VFNINIHIGTNSEAESNEFLKCLWAEIKKEFGKCAWHYQPSKQKGRIYFGDMDIDNDPKNRPSQLVFAVSVSYEERGTIKEIFFDFLKENQVPNKKEIFQRLEKATNSAKQNVGRYSFFQFNTGIKSIYSLSNYEGERFNIKGDSTKCSKLSIIVESYDNNQASGIVTKKVNQLMDFLSVETNAPFWNTKLDEEVTEEIGREIYQEDEEFIDGLSNIDGRLVLSKEGKDFVEKLVNLNNEDNQAMSLFLKACNHFHTARKYHAQLENIYLANPKEDGDKMTYEIKR
jgi:hypothetical protein